MKLVSPPLPKGVRVDNGRYYLVRRENKKPVRHALTLVAEGREALDKAYAALPPLTVRFIRDLLTLFKLQGLPALVECGDLKPDTRKSYEYFIDYRLIPSFGHMLIPSVTSTHVAQYLEAGREIGRPVVANRARSCFSSAFEWGRRKGYCHHNPCRGVRRNKERPSKRYVPHAELTGTYNRAPPQLQLLINAAYLAGMRSTDLRLLLREQLQADGIHFTESKTGKVNVMAYAPGLWEILQRAIAYGDAVATKITKRLPVARPLPTHVFVNARGKPWTASAICSAMHRVGATFALRNLRSKAQTDAQEKNVLGHTGQMRQVYTKVRKLEPVG